MAGVDSHVAVQVLETLVNNPWLVLVAALVIIILGFKTNLVEKITGLTTTGGHGKKEHGNTLQGAQQVQEVHDDQIELSFTEKMRRKSTKIVDTAETGEMKQAIEKCKKFLSTVQATNFTCKIFNDSFQEIDGVENFDKIVENVGKQLKLPEEDIEGIKLSAMGGNRKRDYLAFECAMRDGGSVRLHTGGYQVVRQGDKIDFQIVLNYMDMSDITLKTLPEKAVENLDKKWFKSSQQIGFDKPDEGEDWNSYFQYRAHKNILKELHDM